MPCPSPSDRRRLLQHAGLLAASVAVPAWAQPAKSASRSLVVAQVVDFSQAQQDVSKDFLIGSRAAWQDINAKGGIRGRRSSTRRWKPTARRPA
jgi:ABC-type branched-subunit amino acid transport system substrate-binding protein